MTRGTIRCSIFGHKWRVYRLDMPTFKLHCLRCAKLREYQMPLTPIFSDWEKP